jgi:hypothetical protein
MTKTGVAPVANPATILPLDAFKITQPGSTIYYNVPPEALAETTDPHQTNLGIGGASMNTCTRGCERCTQNNIPLGYRIAKSMDGTMTLEDLMPACHPKAGRHWKGIGGPELYEQLREQMGIPSELLQVAA